MEKFWLSWLKRSGRDGVERRAVMASPVEPIVEADFDEQTGTLKWSRFMTMLEAEQRQGSGSLLLIDLKEQSRHLAAGEAGADVLLLLSRAIYQAIRADDLVAHYEGDRFVVLLRGAQQDIAEEVRARIVESVDNTVFFGAKGIVALDVSIELVGTDAAPGTWR